MLSKKITHKRLRPKPDGKNKKKTTDEDKQYLEWLQSQSYSCFVCGTYDGIEYHHIKEHSSDKKNHKRLISLCVNHHRLSMHMSPHSAPRRWRDTYSMEMQEVRADEIYNEYTLQNID